MQQIYRFIEYDLQYIHLLKITPKTQIKKIFQILLHETK